MDLLEKYCEEKFKRISLKGLIDYENVLSGLLDDMELRESLFLDELQIMYDAVVNECIERVRKMADSNLGIVVS